MSARPKLDWGGRMDGILQIQANRLQRTLVTFEAVAANPSRSKKLTPDFDPVFKHGEEAVLIE
ncbi:MAG: hypothetical protein AB8B91_20730 [Rubripirellula sp.]